MIMNPLEQLPVAVTLVLSNIPPSNQGQWTLYMDSPVDEAYWKGTIAENV